MIGGKDRLGPDVPKTHWMLNNKTLMRLLCQNKFLHFGEHSEIRPGAYIICCSRIWIGKSVVVRPGSHLYADPRAEGGKIVIEDEVLLGPCVHIYTNNHRYLDPDQTIYSQGYDEESISDTVYLRKGCWVGANSVILKGVEIGVNSVVAAGSVVTRSIPPRSLAAGVPARIIKQW